MWIILSWKPKEFCLSLAAFAIFDRWSLLSWVCFSFIGIGHGLLLYKGIHIYIGVCFGFIGSSFETGSMHCMCYRTICVTLYFFSFPCNALLMWHETKRTCNFLFVRFSSKISINILSKIIYLIKGQLISKGLVAILNSSKKLSKKFNLWSTCFVRFLKELKPWKKKSFRN